MTARRFPSDSGEPADILPLRGCERGCQDCPRRLRHPQPEVGPLIGIHCRDQSRQLPRGVPGRRWRLRPGLQVAEDLRPPGPMGNPAGYPRPPSPPGHQAAPARSAGCSAGADSAKGYLKSWPSPSKPGPSSPTASSSTLRLMQRRCPGAAASGRFIRAAKVAGRPARSGMPRRQCADGKVSSCRRADLAAAETARRLAVLSMDRGTGKSEQKAQE
jgi:hypothetical protein